MATFKLLNKNEATFNKCLAAIETVGNASGELWVSKFVEESTKRKSLSGANVLLHNYKLFENTDVNWEREVFYENKSAYEYSNCQGVDICIGEDRGGLSHVYRNSRHFDNIINELDGLHRDELYRVLDQKVIGKIINDDDLELKICEYLR